MIIRRIVLTLLAIFYSVISAVIADEHVYTFWPKEPDNSHVLDPAPCGEPKTNEEFHHFLQANGRDYSYSGTDHIGSQGSTWFWTATMDTKKFTEKFETLEMLAAAVDRGKPPTAAGTVRSPALSTHYGDSSTLPVQRRRKLRKRSTPSVQQAPQRVLKFLSMPPEDHYDLDDPDINYFYYSQAGKGVRVYVVDSGANANNPEIWGDRQPSWIFAQPYGSQQPGDTALDKENKYGHGTCTADVAIGITDGVAKLADVTVVQVDDTSSFFVSYLQVEKYLDALSQVFDDIVRRNIDRQAVVLMPWGWDSAEVETQDGKFASETHYTVVQSAMFKICAAIAGKGVALVASHENRDKCVGPPCIFANPSFPEYIPDMISVDAGVISDGSYGSGDPDALDDWTTIYGPGYDGTGGGVRGFVCAHPTLGPGMLNGIPFEGTSAAASFIAGMIAIWKSVYVDRSNAEIIQLMKDLSYRRADDGPRMPWLGCHPDSCPDP